MFVARLLIISLLVVPGIATADPGPPRKWLGRAAPVEVPQFLVFCPATQLLELLEKNPGRMFRFGMLARDVVTPRAVSARTVWAYAVRKAYKDVGRAFKKRYNSGLSNSGAITAAGVELETAQKLSKNLLQMGRQRLFVHKANPPSDPELRQLAERVVEEHGHSLRLQKRVSSSRKVSASALGKKILEIAKKTEDLKDVQFVIGKGMVTRSKSKSYEVIKRGIYSYEIVRTPDRGRSSIKLPYKGSYRLKDAHRFKGEPLKGEPH